MPRQTLYIPKETRGQKTKDRVASVTVNLERQSQTSPELKLLSCIAKMRSRKTKAGKVEAEASPEDRWDLEPNTSRINVVTSVRPTICLDARAAYKITASQEKGEVDENGRQDDGWLHPPSKGVPTLTLMSKI